MKERKIPPRRSRKKTSEYILGEVDNPENPVTYIKSEGLKEEIYSFYLRFLGEHFRPCAKCQDKIHDMMFDSGRFTVGNKSYEPAVEFSRSFEIIDEAWKNIINRPATKDDMKRAENNEIKWWA